jgi:hypothetical protein
MTRIPVARAGAGIYMLCLLLHVNGELVGCWHDMFLLFRWTSRVVLLLLLHMFFIGNQSKCGLHPGPKREDHRTLHRSGLIRAAGPAHDPLRAVAGSTQNYSGRSKLKSLLENAARLNMIYS